MRGLFPRHLRAANASIFVHAPIRPQTAPVQAGKGKKSVKKIVQNCAVLCSSEVPIENTIQVIFITGLFPFPVVVSVRNEAG
ncbi:hypothetical protein DMT56_07450 [Salmonella enterica]|nr:hypothetical protein [Salmonella enterica]ECH9069460.1 hypothetical protein [Salmonella enterica subsp. enterica]EAM2929456.1 hypothetical protein [Salmonella enterica]EAM3234886.1 hypothetical protein [Salmonella enterica]EAQ6662097.1 hypothetical protein [Salmonella enterica]